jgi:hypothetical protein
VPKLGKAERRERQQRKARHGMRVSGRSLKSTILPVIEKKAKEAKAK